MAKRESKSFVERLETRRAREAAALAKRRKEIAYRGVCFAGIAAALALMIYAVGL